MLKPAMEKLRPKYAKMDYGVYIWSDKKALNGI